MDTNKHELIFKDEVYQIVGCALNVLNGLGHGFFEKIYENAMIVELAEQRIPYHQQQRFQVRYKEKCIGEYIPDLVVFDKISNLEKGQVINYMKTTGLSASVILNFKNAKLEWERIIL